MITLDTIRQIILTLPTTEETTPWDAVSFKVNGKASLIGGVRSSVFRAFP
ncbi:hypothetical protein [Peteryoungia ipomoeae]|nr:hypothetical protein [Peteryoungia ipomoeae]